MKLITLSESVDLVDWCNYHGGRCEGVGSRVRQALKPYQPNRGGSPSTSPPTEQIPQKVAMVVIVVIVVLMVVI